MNGADSHYLIFSLDDQPFALKLSSVTRVVRSVALTIPPDAPDLLMGILNLGGKMIPVLDIRSRFGLPEREMELEDRIIVCVSRGRPMAFFVNAVHGVEILSKNTLKDPQEILAGLPGTLKGVGRWHDDTVLIYDLDALFSIPSIPELPAEQGMEGE